MPLIEVLGLLCLREGTGKKVGHPFVPTSLNGDNDVGSCRMRLPQGYGQLWDSAPLGWDHKGIAESKGELRFDLP